MERAASASLHSCWLAPGVVWRILLYLVAGMLLHMAWSGPKGLALALGQKVRRCWYRTSGRDCLRSRFVWLPFGSRARRRYLQQQQQQAEQARRLVHALESDQYFAADGYAAWAKPGGAEGAPLSEGEQEELEALENSRIPPSWPAATGVAVPLLTIVSTLLTVSMVACHHGLLTAPKTGEELVHLLLIEELTQAPLWFLVGRAVLLSNFLGLLPILVQSVATVIFLSRTRGDNHLAPLHEVVASVGTLVLGLLWLARRQARSSCFSAVLMLCVATWWALTFASVTGSAGATPDETEPGDHFSRSREHQAAHLVELVLLWLVLLAHRWRVKDIVPLDDPDEHSESLVFEHPAAQQPQQPPASSLPMTGMPVAQPQLQQQPSRLKPLPAPQQPVVTQPAEPVRLRSVAPARRRPQDQQAPPLPRRPLPGQQRGLPRWTGSSRGPLLPTNTAPPPSEQDVAAVEDEEDEEYTEPSDEEGDLTGMYSSH